MTQEPFKCYGGPVWLKKKNEYGPRPGCPECDEWIGYLYQCLEVLTRTDAGDE